MTETVNTGKLPPPSAKDQMKQAQERPKKKPAPGMSGPAPAKGIDGPPIC